jgi:hypothetical protein
VGHRREAVPGAQVRDSLIFNDELRARVGHNLCSV